MLVLPATHYIWGVEGMQDTIGSVGKRYAEEPAGIISGSSEQKAPQASIARPAPG